MKKILSFLGIISLITSGSSNLIACNKTDNNEKYTSNNPVHPHQKILIEN